MVWLMSSSQCFQAVHVQAVQVDRNVMRARIDGAANAAFISSGGIVVSADMDSKQEKVSEHFTTHKKICADVEKEKGCS